MNGTRKSKPVGVLTKTFRIIDALQTAPSPLALKEISEQTAINKSTALRFLSHLEAEGWVARDARGSYSIGGRLLQPGARSTFHVHLRDAAQAPLRELWRITQETVNLGVLDGVEVLYLECLESPQSFRLVANSGTRAVAYRTALGKALIAHCAAERRDAILGSMVFQAFTPKTITSRERFRNELDKARRRGYAIDDEESVIGVRCLAAPVLNPGGDAVAAVSISGPTARMRREKVPQFAAAVCAAAGQISSTLFPGR